MDWEKQDNELRNLIGGTGFLPEGENWDARGAWEKLKEKKKPAMKMIAPIWLRIATAACVIGLLGWGFFIFQSQRNSAIVIKETASQNLSKGNGLKANEMPFIVDNQSDTAIISLNENIARIVKESVVDKKEQTERTLLPDENKGRNKPVTNNQKTAISASNGKEAVPTNAKLISNIVNQEEALATVIPPEPQPSSLSVVPAKVVKPPLRVVHFNDLNGKRSTPPSGFARSKKPDQDWDVLVLGSTHTYKEPSLQLKIDISPASKKSL